MTAGNGVSRKELYGVLVALSGSYVGLWVWSMDTLRDRMREFTTGERTVIEKLEDKVSGIDSRLDATRTALIRNQGATAIAE